MAVENTAFIKCLTDNPANELEEHEMLAVDVAEWIGMECCSVGGNWVEESIVGVEHLLSQDLEPLAGYSTSVDTFFSMESNVELAVLEFLGLLVVKRLERIQEYDISTDRKLKRWM
jgi:hypothetical protein